jgi:hypothetical protein
MTENRRKRPRDTNQLAKLVADIASGEVEDAAPESRKNPSAVALGKMGGKKGGAARAKALTAEQRSEIAKKAAAARWNKSRN